MADSAVLHACTIETGEASKPLEGNAVSKTVKDKKLAWVHLDANIAASRLWLEKEISYLDQIILDALHADDPRPRILEFDQGILLILRGVNLNENAAPEDMISIRLWIDEHRIISLSRRPLKAVKDLHERLLEGKGPQNAADFLIALTTRLLERMEPIFAALDESLDEIEEEIIEEPDVKKRHEITTIRKQAIMFRRYIAPQRDVIAQLRVSELQWINAAHKRQLQETWNHVQRYLEDLDEIRERASVVKDELTNTLADQMNKNTYILSVIAAVFLPLGFLTGLLGINIAGIPGAEYPHAFTVFCAILIVIVIAQAALFRKMKWL